METSDYQVKVFRMLLISQGIDVNDSKAETILSIANSVLRGDFEQNLDLAALDQVIENYKTARNIRHQGRFKTYQSAVASLFVLAAVNAKEKKIELTKKDLKAIADQAKELMELSEEFIKEDLNQLYREEENYIQAVLKEKKIINVQEED